MNLPNKLTVSRFFFTVGFLIALLSQMPAGETIALALCVVASITDYLDRAEFRHFARLRTLRAAVRLEVRPPPHSPRRLLRAHRVPRGYPGATTAVSVRKRSTIVQRSGGVSCIG